MQMSVMSLWKANYLRTLLTESSGFAMIRYPYSASLESVSLPRGLGRELRMLVSTATVVRRGEGGKLAHPRQTAQPFLAVYASACTHQEGRTGLDTTMCRPLGAVPVLLLLLIGAAGRNILQDSGNAEPTSFAAKENANTKQVTSADAATRQALQNQKTVQLQGRQTQIRSHSTQKKTLQQVGEMRRTLY